MQYSEFLEKKQYFDKVCSPSASVRKEFKEYAFELNKELDNSHEKSIKIVTDYDADGLTSAYNMCKILDQKKVNYEVVFNNRFEGGYSLPEINVSKDDLVIILDNGTNEVDYVKDIYKNTGVKPFIIDHHISENKEISKYSHLLNFKYSKDKNIPDYCTAGLTGKIYEVFYDEIFPREKMSKQELDILLMNKNDVVVMTGIGTIADCVSVTNANDDNRKLILDAFDIMNNATSLYEKEDNKYAVSDELGAFIYATNKDNFGIESKALVTTRNIQFNVAPAINACGRLDTDAPLKLLNSLQGKDNGEGMAEAIMLNNERKAIKDEVLHSEEYLDVVNSDKPINILISEKIPEGICGIIAGQLAEENGKPSIVVTRTSDGYRGSGRNGRGYPSLYETCSPIMEKIAESFGGHSEACGMLIKNPQDLYQLYDAYKDVEIQYMEEGEGILEIPEGGITTSMVYALEPFGTDNQPPVYESEVFVKTAYCIGNNPDWVKFTADNSNLNYITFSEGTNIHAGEKVIVRGEIGVNHYRGINEVQISVNESFQKQKTQNTVIDNDEPEYE